MNSRRVSELHIGIRQNRCARPHPGRGPEVLANRINIDTGAFATRRLTCVVLDKVRHRFLTI